MTDTLCEKIKTQISRVSLRDVKLHPAIAEKWNSPLQISVEEYNSKIRESVFRREKFIDHIKDRISRYNKVIQDYTEAYSK